MSGSFHLGDVLSITTERLVAPGGMASVHALLDFLTGDQLFSHQLGRAVAECGPFLLEQHPALAGVVVPDAFASPEAVHAWLAEQVALHGETLEVEPIPAEAHARRDPIAELIGRVGPEKVVVVSVDDGRAP